MLNRSPHDAPILQTIIDIVKDKKKIDTRTRSI
jgi:hypothetical protein